MSYQYLNKWLEEKNIRLLSNTSRLLYIDNDSLTKRLEILSKKEFTINIIKQKIFYLSINDQLYKPTFYSYKNLRWKTIQIYLTTIHFFHYSQEIVLHG